MLKFPVTAREVMEDELKNMVIVRASSEAHFHDELKDDGIPADDWTYHGEYIFILSMNESGDKINEIVEFLDSKGTERALALVKRARGNKEKANTKDT